MKPSTLAASLIVGTLLLTGCSEELTAELPLAALDEPGKSPNVEVTEELIAELSGPETSGTGYDPDKFPTWSSQGDNCNTREWILKHEGENVVTGDDCYPTRGTWHSPYDAETWTDASDVDIDHVVPKKEAWISGASEWTEEVRERFANDLDSPQLVAVTDNVNQSKGDRDPAEWMPPDADFHCQYADWWVRVKNEWRLSIDPDEAKALRTALQTC